MWSWIETLAELSRDGVTCALVTVTTAAGSTPREAGAKLIALADGRFFGTIGGGHLEEIVLGEAREAIARGTSRALRIPLGPSTGQCCGGVVELFVDVVGRGPELYVFGAGHVGQAVARVLDGTPFRVHLIDERPEWIGSDAIPKGTVRHDEPWDAVVADIAWGPRTYAVIMTHRHDLDQEILEALLDKDLYYLGLIGSATKWAKFQARLKERGVSAGSLARVRCPIGLPIGGKAPQEVAISLAAELLSRHHGTPAITDSGTRSPPLP